MRLLLVEDDSMIGDTVRLGLRKDGFTVDWIRDGESARTALSSETYDIVVLDLGLPRVDGLEILRYLRSLNGPRGRVPVLVVTARDAVPDRVTGLDAGADDYLVKPFDFGELSARLRALIRRQAGRGTNIVVHGELAFDTVNRSLTVAGEPVSLSARELALFEALMLRPGAVLSKAQLEDRIYGWSDKIESNAIEVHMHSLRRKIGAHRIRTIRGVGYVLAD
jgi:two-component system response regulator QseB